MGDTWLKFFIIIIIIIVIIILIISWKVGTWIVLLIFDTQLLRLIWAC